jgi:protoporphyrinogen oxidase
MATVLIAGAGPAGLTAAYESSKLGWHPIVLEADEQVGGLSRTVNYRGYRFDIGGHRFFSKVPLINELWREILGEELLVRPRLSRIFYGNRFFGYPLNALEALTGLGPLEALRIALSYVRSRAFPHKEEANFQEWVTNRFGERLYEIFFKTYTEKVWGIPCTEISADWAAQRIKNLSLLQAMRNALTGNGHDSQREIITTLIKRFSYPRLGPGMMWERCRDLVAACGGRTISGARVNRILHDRGRVKYVFARMNSGELEEFRCDHFISTMPLAGLIGALDPAPPDDVMEAASRLRYRDHLTVVLILNRESVFPDNWIYIHSPEVGVGRIQNYKNWSPAMVPDPSRTSLGLEYFLSDQSEEWSWPAERLIERGIKECAGVGLIDPAEIEDGAVVRASKAYPVYDHEYRKAVGTIRRYLGDFSNLQTIGRNGLHRYNNQDHSMLTAIYAARNLVGEKHDVWSVNTEREYHEAQSGRADSGDRLVPRRTQAAEPVD